MFLIEKNTKSALALSKKGVFFKTVLVQTYLGKIPCLFGVWFAILIPMFMSASDRKKNGKSHIYHRVMEKRCVAEGRWIQRQVIYPGELTSAQEESRRRALEFFDPQRGEMQTMTLFAKPEVAPPEKRLLLNKPGLELPQQPPKKIYPGQLAAMSPYQEVPNH